MPSHFSFPFYRAPPSLPPPLAPHPSRPPLLLQQGAAGVRLLPVAPVVSRVDGSVSTVSVVCLATLHRDTGCYRAPCSLYTCGFPLALTAPCGSDGISCAPCVPPPVCTSTVSASTPVVEDRSPCRPPSSQGSGSFC